MVMLAVFVSLRRVKGRWGAWEVWESRQRTGRSEFCGNGRKEQRREEEGGNGEMKRDSRFGQGIKSREGADVENGATRVEVVEE